MSTIFKSLIGMVSKQFWPFVKYTGNAINIQFVNFDKLGDSWNLQIKSLCYIKLY